MAASRHFCMTVRGRTPLALLLLLFLPLQVLAADKQASFVVDGNTGKVLHDQQADELRYPASLTKMMTLYMAFEQIEAGRMDNGTMLTISVACASMAPSKIGLEVGERISLGNAIKAVVTKSANDMACAIAESIAGNEREFARRMTSKARSIGMSNSTFRNASGLPDPGQLTTARDMVTLGLRLRDDFPKHFGLFQMRSFSYGGKMYRSHNTLMNGFVGMDGIKTGYTRASGFNLVSSVQRDGKYVVGAVFGGVTAGVRNAHMRMILFRALETASTEKTRKSSPMLIARAKPATNPKAERVVAQVSEKPSVKAPKKTVARKPTDEAALQALAAASPDQPPAAEPAIKIAKVRAVMVAGQSAGAQPPSAPATAEARNEPVVQKRPQFATASAAPPLAANRPGNLETLINSAPPRAPGTLAAQAAEITDETPENTARADALGLRPSSMDRPSERQKLAELSRPETQTAGLRQSDFTAPLRAPQSANGSYLIQVGAFATEGECKRHLEKVRGRAPAHLQDTPALAEEATVNQRQVFRARFAQFDSTSANAACAALRQQKVDCMVIKAR